MKSRCVLLSLLFVFSLPPVLAKTEPNLVMLWPPDKPALKLTFEKFRQVGNYAGQSTFVSEVTVQNLTDKKIPRVVHRLPDGQGQCANRGRIVANL